MGAALAVKVNTTRRMMMMLCGGVCVLRATLIAFDSANWIIRYLGRRRRRRSEHALIIRFPTSRSVGRRSVSP